MLVSPLTRYLGPVRRLDETFGHRQLWLAVRPGLPESADLGRDPRGTGDARLRRPGLLKVLPLKWITRVAAAAMLALSGASIVALIN
jgi:hypothetical protein